VITTDRGLVPPEQFVTIEDLRKMAGNCIDPKELKYRKPLERDVARIAGKCDVVLLGSVASGKYVEILVEILGARLLFPGEFVGVGICRVGGCCCGAWRSGGS
jgi:hypothetical protein